MDKQNAEIYFNKTPVGILSRKNGKFIFRYYDSYLLDETKPAISLTLPKRKEEFISDHLFSFSMVFLLKVITKKFSAEC
ncbi:MAG: HipA N-terminal domain-containing protein [Melioribacteraceae bacterium]|nr:HipA N-terminal domain-containing protein [Melioribacteraceae bacterium]